MAAPRRHAASSITATNSTRGIILDAKIVPPTSQNQKTIEQDLAHFVAQSLTPDRKSS